MSLEALVAAARARGASDLHLEPGLPPAVRVRGDVVPFGDPLPHPLLARFARELLGERRWKGFLERKSDDLSRTLSGVRCRINVLRTSRGVGFAVRLLSAFQPTLEGLNLHPALGDLVRSRHGLLLFSGPTGCGKSSTMAALLHEINLSEPRHILTIEQPIEFLFRPRKAYIRQREVGRDTPSFQQGLIDAMREDPDILMVGEMRDPDTMRLTLNAAETGHLVLATVHSSNCVEALDRVVAAFAPEIRSGIQSQLADCLRAVVAQRLVFREDLGIRVPELEILVATTPIRSLIRQGSLFKIAAALETGAQNGQWTFRRYREWLAGRRTFFAPQASTAEPPDSEAAGEQPAPASAGTAAAEAGGAATGGGAVSKPGAGPEGEGKDVIVIEPPAPEESIGDILSELDGE